MKTGFFSRLNQCRPKKFHRIGSFIERSRKNPKRSKENFQSAEIFSLLDKCKVMARTAKAERPIKSFMNPDYKGYIPRREVSDQLVSHYLRTFEFAYRILHIPSFQAEYARYWDDLKMQVLSSL